MHVNSQDTLVQTSHRGARAVRLEGEGASTGKKRSIEAPLYTEKMVTVQVQSFYGFTCLQQPWVLLCIL